MSTKLALALSLLIAFPLLETLNFTPDSLDNKNNLIALAVIYAAVPIVLKLFTIVILAYYPISHERQQTVRKRLATLEAKHKG